MNSKTKGLGELVSALAQTNVELWHEEDQARLPEEADGMPSRGFDALAELTSSEVIQQVKEGLSRITPLDIENDTEGPAY